MAARKHLSHPEIVRQRIRVSQLTTLLQNHALKPLKYPCGQSQMKAIEILLKKSLPDLQSIDMTVKGDVAQPLVISNADSRL